MKRNLMKYAMAGTMLLVPITTSIGQDQQKYADEHAVKHLVNAGDVIGSELWDFQGNSIGTIDGVMLEPSGKTVLAIVDADKWLEQDRKVAIPWSKIYVRTKADDSDEIIYTLDVTKEQLGGAPEWTSASEAADPAAMDAFFRYWKVDRDSGNAQTGTDRPARPRQEGRDVDVPNE